MLLIVCLNCLITAEGAVLPGMSSKSIYGPHKNDPDNNYANLWFLAVLIGKFTFHPRISQAPKSSSSG